LACQQHDGRIRYFRVDTQTNRILGPTSDSQRWPIARDIMAATKIEALQPNLMPYLPKRLNTAKEAMRERQHHSVDKEGG
jgi:hypothetical protein